MGSRPLLLLCAWLTEKGREKEEEAGWVDPPADTLLRQFLPVVVGRHGRRRCCATEEAKGGREKK
jgi:hypothetical protein